ncbi:unnamed protein product [Leptosia nina]|uniref:Kinesin motor domain-containing protein n=1 Tax=Leptosia nina TaxID=320188 RepID=A0AAV1IYA2_9NEOP
MSDTISESEISKRDVPSFIEPRPPLITNPFMRPRPQKGTNLMDLFEDDSDYQETDLVQVFLRLKPCSIPSNLYDVRGERCLITSLDTATAGHGRRTQHNVSKMYTFSHIFRENASQKDIFDHVVKDNLKRLKDGHSFTLLTYGASGSGKTYTLMGTVASPGLVPRSLEYLFKTVCVETRPVYKPAEGGIDILSISAQENELMFVKKIRKLSAPLRDKYRRMSVRLSTEYTGSSFNLNSNKHYVWVSFIEIYNEGIYDLLATTENRSSPKLLIREDASGNVFVKGATQVFVRSGEEAYDIMVAGKHNLQVAATGVHAQSSRSHCIFTITMLNETENGCTTSCVRLCDLAGCERARRTRNTGARMQESRAINSSLHVLERCLHTLRRKQTADHNALVPYRESKLTRLLGAGLSGARGEAVSMVVTLNPSPEYTNETKHVLQLAAVAKDIQINNTLSEYPSSLESSIRDHSGSLNSELMKLRTCNERLRFELLQAQNHNKELSAMMEERRATNADTMRELVDEVKENSRLYYEPQIDALNKEIEDLKEEYESLISGLKRRLSAKSPSMRDKVAELVTEIAILKERLSAEQLARARVEEEVQHLRACIEERDENTNNEVDLSSSESDIEEIDAICNESLEPTFKRVDINRSRLMQQSLNLGNVSHTSIDSVLEYSDINIQGEKCNNGHNEKTEEKHCMDNHDIPICCEKDNLPPLLDAETDSFVNNDTKKYKRKDSLAQFEKLELAAEACEVSDSVVDEKFGTQVRSKLKSFFNDNGENIDIKTIENLVNEGDERSPSIVQDVANNNNSESSLMRKLLTKNISSTRKVLDDTSNDLTLVPAIKLLTPNCNNYKMSHESVDLFDSPHIAKDTCSVKAVDSNIVHLGTKVEKQITIKPQSDILSKCHVSNVSISPLSRAVNSTDLVDKDSTSCKSKDILLPRRNSKTPTEKEFNMVITEVISNEYEIKHSSSENLGIATKQFHENILNNDTQKSMSCLGTLKCKEESLSIETEGKPIRANITLNKGCYEDTTVTDKSPETEAFVKDHDDAFKIPNDNSNNNIKNHTLVNNLKDNCYENKVEENVHTIETNEKVKAIMDFATSSIDNTLEAFENIYKDISVPRATQFDLLLTKTEETLKLQSETESKYNLRKKSYKTKSQYLTFGESKDEESKEFIRPSNLIGDKVSLESQAKCETKKKRNLRLRRRKNDDDDKNIVNLQTEFSDVTMDVPAPGKVVQDIPSPEKSDGENMPPSLEIQSCPSKSITRSRRKLFTPRAEPLEEVCPQTVDSDERLRVPRPSYHRPRARRKL